ncbi:hypothetical protein GUITHDRAFT_152774 [Guillardia theta CCMP2712]|uniref:5-hydroxyisourate hydrolase n=1 Tax=Guillardia theta (strain CCMP2712) TaxID=905079 RepID=L1J9M1_GUITC|nr:hypothetical protein GUITHDRAFT_152774 [Guillardia theta CCMP2712]EKX45231.1 hypothetical protein GUITHDRAFT_152774 [Guillardia theta CCMP2712]|eukprot:XP_005832211.1 hypothetical protein GUITHDRAFT_152774 [Guillardia theta CCMP2712]
MPNPGKRPPITSHVLDCGVGRPAADLLVVLEQKVANQWQEIGRDKTNSDGRCPKLLSVDHKLQPGIYRCTFDTAGYYAASGGTCFYPEVTIAFEIVNVNEHYHIPLLLNQYGYSTYRGS